MDGFKKIIGVGIIGTGGIADTAHAPAVESNTRTELRAVLSRSTESGEAFKRKHGSNSTKIYQHIEDFLTDKDVQLIIICSPDGSHYSQALASLKAGKHVLLEKPMTTSVEEAQILCDISTKNNLLLAMGFHIRAHQGLRLLKEKLQTENVIGDIRHIRVIWAFPQKDDSNWRTKEEFTKWWSLSAVGSHCLDIARWFTNDMEEWQKFNSIISNNIWGGPHDESAQINAQFQNGITADIMSSVQFGPYNRIEIFGENGIVLCDGVLGREGTGSISINGQNLEYQTTNPFSTQLDRVIDSLESGMKPFAEATDGLRGVEDLVRAVIKN